MSKNDLVNKSRYKLIALDMDGTLLNDENNISKENSNAINKAKNKGVEVVISTGRSFMNCRTFVEDLNLDSYVVTANGSEVWHMSGELIQRHILRADLVQMMYDLKQKYNTQFWASTIDQVWRDEEFPEDITKHQWLKFGFDIKNDEIRNTIFKTLSDHEELEVSNSSLTNIEINAAGVNKAMALAMLCERLDLTMTNVLAIGDSLNDIAMIKESGCGVAMDNAQEVVKKTADWVTSSNNDHGVAKAIERFVL